MHSIREVFRKVICVKNTTIIKNINIKDKVSKRDFEIVNYFYGNRVKWMNIFKVSEEERIKIIEDILNNITPEELLNNLIEEGLEIPITITDKKYESKEDYANDSEYNTFNIHRNWTRRISLRKRNRISEKNLEDAA